MQSGASFAARLRNLLAVLMSVVLVTACSPAGESDSNSGQSSHAASGRSSEGAKTITDSHGNEFATPANFDEVIVLNSSVYDMISVLGKEDLVVGVGDTVTGYGADEKPKFGGWKKPNVEKIVEAKPDAVFGYASWLDSGEAAKLKDAGIPVVMLDLFQPSTILTEVTFLGELLGAQDRAQEFIADVEKIASDVTSRTADVTKKTAYWEGHSDYTSVGKGSGGDELLNKANVVNLAGNEDTKYPKVSDEWIVEQNPELIVKMVSSSKKIMGPGNTDAAAVEAFYQEFVNRPGWQGIDAVSNKSVILFSDQVGTNPLGMALVPAYIAKAAYPQEMKDIDPDALLDQLLQKYWHTDAASGIWVYHA